MSDPNDSALPMTLGDVANRYGCQLWQVRRLFERKLLPEARRVGAARVVFASDLPEIEQALKSAGYLKAERPMAVA